MRRMDAKRSMEVSGEIGLKSVRRQSRAHSVRIFNSLTCHGINAEVRFQGQVPLSWR